MPRPPTLPISRRPIIPNHLPRLTSLGRLPSMERKKPAGLRQPTLCRRAGRPSVHSTSSRTGRKGVPTCAGNAPPSDAGGGKGDDGPQYWDTNEPSAWLRTPTSPPPSPPDNWQSPPAGVPGPRLIPDSQATTAENESGLRYAEALRGRWKEVGHFYDDAGPFYGVSDDEAFDADEEWNFADWGDPEPHRSRQYLNMTLHAVIWKLDQGGMSDIRRGHMTRFITLLRAHIESHESETSDHATGGMESERGGSPPASPPAAPIPL